MVEQTVPEKQAVRRREIYIVIIVFALLMSLLFAGGIVYEKRSRNAEREHMVHVLRVMSNVVMFAATDKKQGEDVIRVMRLTDPQFKAIPTYGQILDQLFVLAPTTRGSVYLLKKNAPRRIIAWSKKMYSGERLILWSDFSINWEPVDRVDLIARTVRECPK